MKELKIKMWTLLPALFACYMVITPVKANATATPNYPCACGDFVVPEGVIIDENSSGFKANGSTITGTCDIANGYYGSCEVVPGGRLSSASFGCTYTREVTLKCSGSTWVVTNPCGKSGCPAGDISSYKPHAAANHGDNSVWTCDSHKRHPKTFYCINGTWSFDGADAEHCDDCRKNCGASLNDWCC